jgi:chromosomal replication initiator protein
LLSGLFSIPSEASCCATFAPQVGAAPRRERRFLAGPENALLASALAAVRLPAEGTNPLVLTGVSGSGKSLLLQLLVDEFRQCYADGPLLATTGVDLARAYAHAVETDDIGEFRGRYSRLQLLAIDDIDRLGEKQPAQQELQRLIDALVRRGSLVLATVRSHPLDAQELSYPLASRLAAGLVVPLALPQQGARQALIEQFAAASGIEFSPAALEALASPAAAARLMTAPQIRRAVISLAEMARQRGRPVDRQLAREYMQAADADAKGRLKAIAAAVGRHFAISVSELRGKSRSQSVAAARGLAMHLARSLSGASYAAIGRYFGNRDHTTVMHACRKTAAAAAAEPDLQQLIERLSLRLSAEDVGP